MTSEEIEELKGLAASMGLYDDINPCKRAVILGKAIKTLEQESILEKINKMKSEIASSLEFWDYSPNNNPLARDILETVTYFWGDIKAESEK